MANRKDKPAARKDKPAARDTLKDGAPGTDAAVSGKMTPIQKQEPAVSHYVTEQGFFNLFTVHEGIAKSWVNMLENCLKEQQTHGAAAVFALADAAINKLNAAKKEADKIVDPAERHAAVKAAQSRYMTASNRRSEFRNWFGCLWQGFIPLHDVKSEDGTTVKEQGLSSMDRFSSLVKCRKLLDDANKAYDGTPTDDTARAKAKDSAEVRQLNRRAMDIAAEDGVSLLDADEAAKKKYADKARDEIVHEEAAKALKKLRASAAQASGANKEKVKVNLANMADRVMKGAHLAVAEFGMDGAVQYAEQLLTLLKAQAGQPVAKQ